MNKENNYVKANKVLCFAEARTQTEKDKTAKNHDIDSKKRF